MTKPKTNLNFHQTFPPDEYYISTLFEVAEQECPYTKEEISDLTGIPTGKSSGKVEPFIKYAEFMGLLTDEYKDKKHLLRLTSVGKEIQEQDIGLQEKATIYLCHSNLVSSQGASLWNSVFGEIVPQYGLKIRQLILKDSLKNIYDDMDINMAPFNSSYGGMFKKLNVFKVDKDGIEVKLLKYKDSYIYIYAYILFKEWENIYGEVSELTSIDLYDMQIDSKLCLSRDDFDKALDAMEYEGLIKMERVLNPFIILKLHSSEEIISKIYSRI